MDLKSLPKKVLDLFPRWSYQCPECGKQYDDAVQVCVQCGTQYDESKWRVPPRFLKNYEALSEYAHKVLAPKLSSKQRELLFKYFTELFSDGFESGDFSEWDVTQNDVSVETDNPHHGSYNLEASANYSYSRVTTYFDETDPVYARAYIKFTTLPPNNDEYIRVIEMRSPNYYADAAIIKSGGDIYWYIHTGEGQYLETTASNPTTGIYYCVEIKRSNSDNNAQVWVDGELKVTASGLTITEGVSYVRLGIVYCTCDTTVMADCVVIADTPIGLEEEEEPPAGAEANFETGDTSEFDETPTSGGTVTAVSDVAHHGTYSCKCDVNSDGSAYAEGYFDVAEQQPVYCRGYFRFNQLPETNKDYTLICFEDTDGPTTVGYVQLIDDNGTTKWKMRRDTGSPTYSTSTDNIPEENAWVCIEFAHGDDLAKLWVNGDELLTHTDASDQTIDRVHIGACSTDISSDDTLELHIDCVVVSDEPIGPEAPDLEVNYLTVNKKLLIPCIDAQQLEPFEMVDAIYGWTTSYLVATASSGQKNVSVANPGGFSSGDKVFLRNSTITVDTDWETPTIDYINGNTLTMTANLEHTYELSANPMVDKWTPGGFILPENFLQIGTDQSGKPLGVFIVRESTYNDPLLTTDRGMVVKKDITAGGFIGTNQGEVWIGHGRDYATDPPKILLMHSGSAISDTTYSNFVPLVSTFGFNVGDIVQITDGNNSESQIVQSLSEDPIGIQTRTSLTYTYEEGNVYNYDTLHIERLDGTLANVKLNNLTVNGGFNSSINPTDDDTYGLGSGSHRWQGIVALTGYFDEIKNTSGNTYVLDLANMPNQGTDGYVLTAQGAGNPPVWAAAGTGGSHTHDASDIISGTLATARIPVLSYSKVSFCNQNLNMTNDAIFNSVLCANGCKAGGSSPYFASLTHDGSHGYVTAHYGALILGAAGGYVSFGSAINLVPYAVNAGNIGTDTQYWGSVWTNYLRYKNSSSFDALDDLALVKNYKTTNIEQNGVQVEVIDHESLPFLVAEKTDPNAESFFDAGKVNGFLLGCVKRLAEEVDTLQNRISEIENKKETV